LNVSLAFTYVHNQWRDLYKLSQTIKIKKTNPFGDLTLLAGYIDD